MASRPLLAVRPDAGPGVGVGHVARTLALAQEWMRQGGAAVLVAEAVPALWEDRWREAGATVVAPGEAPGGADWWVVDGYRRAGAARPPGRGRLLTIDDHDGAGTGGAGADLLLDQNLGATAPRYPAAPPGALLLGPRYALLRADLVAAREAPAPAPPPESRGRVVVAMGGAPPPDLRALAAAVAAAPALAGIDVNVLDGHRDVAAALPGATVAVSAAGSTAWELCLLGIPAVLVAVAPNQEPVAAALTAAGAARRSPPDAEAVVAAVTALLADPGGRQGMSAAGRALVDGAGALRVVTRLRAELLALRPAGPADSRSVHRWNDDPETRAASFSPDPIPWADHERWFAARLADPGAALYLAADSAGADVGVVRFACEGDRAVISVAVAPERRGQRWGAALVAAGCARLAHDRGPVAVEALIKADNTRSQRSFLAADFTSAGTADPGVVRYVRPVDAEVGSGCP